MCGVKRDRIRMSLVCLWYVEVRYTLARISVLNRMAHVQFASLGGFLFGYDQGVVSGVLTMESFAAEFPRIYLDSGFKGWFVSVLLLCAWLGSLINGPIADRFGRKGSILAAVFVFLLGSAIQAGARTIPMLFGGERLP